MAYAWANTITTATGLIRASAMIEIRTNLSAELTARSTSYAWAHVTAITSGAYIKANEIKEFRTAADLASASTGCTSENSSEDSTVNASANSAADSTKNNTVDVGQDSSVDGTANSTADTGENTSVDLSKHNTDNAAYDGSEDSGENLGVNASFMDAEKTNHDIEV